MRELRDHTQLAGSARHALETVVADYDHYQQSRTEIRRYLTNADDLMEEHRHLTRIRLEIAARDILIEHDKMYSDWIPKAQQLTEAGLAIFDNPERHGSYLHENPQAAERILENLNSLTDALGPHAPSISRERGQDLSEHEENAQRHSTHRSI